MKELSIEEKAKRYDEAIEKAEKWHNAPNIDKIPTFGNKIIEDIFPELKMSEDERIRKATIEFVRQNNSFNCTLGISKEQVIAWIEKQGELKPIERDTEIHDLWVYIREWNDKFGRLPVDEDELASCIDYVMKRQKTADKVEQKPSWSEEDNKMLDSIIDCLDGTGLLDFDQIDWLKSIKHKSHWKPSEEQMEALKKRTQGLHTNSETRKILESLIFDLQEKL